MVSTDSRFAINEKDVAAKVIDGEAIIINLANGMYYSLDQTGAAAWRLLGARRSVQEASAALARHYGVEAGRVQEDLTRLIADLLEQKLIVAATGDAAAEPIDLDAPGEAGYTPPTLHSYDDMGDVLALDPPLPQVVVTEEPWKAA